MLDKRSSRARVARTENNDTRRAISALLILRPTQLDHVLRRWVCDVDLAQNSVAVICEAAEGVCVGRRAVDAEGTRTHRIPPIGSRIIFSMAFGPRHVLITSATVYASRCEWKTRLYAFRGRAAPLQR